MHSKYGLLLLPFLVLAACTETTEPETIDRVEITPGLIHFDALGESSELDALVLSTDGSEMESAEVTWSTSNAAVATVSGAGLVTATGPGSATVSATAEGAVGRAQVVVEQTVYDVSLAADSVVLNYLGAERLLVAEVLDARGGVVAGAIVSWSSTAPDTVAVDAGGGIVGLRTGTARIIVQAENGTADTLRVRVRQVAATVQVTPALDSIQAGESTVLTALVQDSGSSVIANAPLTWTSSANGTATVMDLGGQSAQVTGVSAGDATITATSGSAAGTALVNVRLVAAASIELSPDSAVLFVDSTRTFAATLRDGMGAVLSPAGRTITWSSTDATVASVAADGDSAVVTALAVGTTDIVVTTDGVADTARVRVVSLCSPGAIGVADTVAGELTVDDCDNAGRFYDRWVLNVPTGDDANVSIDLSSASFDTWLTLEDADGNVVVEADGGGPGTDAHLDVTLAAGGTYGVIATSAAAGATGPYTLSVADTSSLVSIATARQQTVGDSVSVIGVITAGTGTYSTHSFYLQDATAGIAVFLTSGTLSPWSVGDSVRLDGTINAFNQEIEINGVATLLGTGTVPAPAAVTSSDVAGGQRQGELVVLEDAIVDSVGTTAGTFYRVYLTDASGATVVHVDTATSIPSGTFEPGATYDVTGLMARTDDVFYVKPRSDADVQQVAAAVPCDAWQYRAIAVGGVADANLEATDCLPGDGFYYEAYRLDLAGPTTVTIDLTSPDFDAYLVLTDTVDTDPSNNANWIANDDDSGAGLDAQIVVSLPAGSYVVWATSAFGAESGAYSLSVN